MNNVFPTLEVYILFLQTIATVGLDKKLYTLDSGSRRPTQTIPHEAPFSSLAYNDDGTILAAGTNSGRVVFYDVRGKPKPLTILRAYNTSEVRNHIHLFSFVCKLLLTCRKFCFLLYFVVLCSFFFFLVQSSVLFLETTNPWMKTKLYLVERSLWQ